MAIENKIAIIGLGYVGLPLALAFSKHYSVVGYDVNTLRIADLQKGVDSNLETSLFENDSLVFSANAEDIAEANIYIVTVPTPVTKDNLPDLSFLKVASELIAKYLQKGDVVIYESTVYPGVTEEICVPILEECSKLRYNIDFYCGYSPERISPGAKEYSLQNVIKVTSGSTPVIADVVDSLYGKVIDAGTYKAPSIKVAEAAKVVENTQRDVNIALINELAMLFDRMGVDTSEVLAAARTKWNFLDFKPGLVGGHCIGVDPYYLTFKSAELGYKPNLMLSSRKINNSVANFIVNKAIKLMIAENKVIKGADVLLLGYTFKENCSDTRNTKVTQIAKGLQEFSCNVSIYDLMLKILKGWILFQTLLVMSLNTML